MGSYILNEAKMYADITDNIAIIINSQTGIYYGLNAFSTNIYENIAKEIDSDIILEKIKNFKNAPTSIEESFNTFINNLIKKEIIIPSENPPKTQVNINETIAKQDEFVLEVQEYDDAQELLLADPIHEVKEDIGWTPEKSSIAYTKEETLEREKALEL